MNRRRFLTALATGLAGAAAAAIIDPDKLLWVPGVKTYFLPPPPQVFTDIPSGISIRLLREFTLDKAQFPVRFDVLYGMAKLRPEFAARAWEAAETSLLYLHKDAFSLVSDGLPRDHALMRE